MLSIEWSICVTEERMKIAMRADQTRYEMICKCFLLIVHFVILEAFHFIEYPFEMTDVNGIRL